MLDSRIDQRIAPPAASSSVDSTVRTVDPRDALELLPSVVREDIGLSSQNNMEDIAVRALRHAPFYYYDFGGDVAALTACRKNGNGAVGDDREGDADGADRQLTCSDDNTSVSLQRKPRHVTSMVVVDPGATLTLSVASESRRACPEGPENQLPQSILWCVWGGTGYEYQLCACACVLPTHLR